MILDTSKWRSYSSVGLAAFLCGCLLGYCGPRSFEVRHSTALSSGAVNVPTHEISAKVPVRALDKEAVKDEVPKSAIRNPKSEILQTGKVSDDSGKRTVSAVLDTNTGTTQIVQDRKFAEWMHRSEIGLGYGLVRGELAPGAFAERTFGRVGSLYGSVRGEAFKRQDETDWNAMLWVSWRW